MGHPLSQIWMGDCQHWGTIAVWVTKSCSYGNLLSLRKTIQLSELPILQKRTPWGEAGLRCTEAQLTQVMWIWPSTPSSTRPRGPSTRFIAMWVEGHNSLHHSYRDFFSIYYITITQKDIRDWALSAVSFVGVCPFPLFDSYYSAAMKHGEKWELHLHHQKGLKHKDLAINDWKFTIYHTIGSDQCSKHRCTYL